MLQLHCLELARPDGWPLPDLSQGRRKQRRGGAVGTTGTKILWGSAPQAVIIRRKIISSVLENRNAKPGIPRLD